MKNNIVYANTFDDSVKKVDFKTALFKGQPENGELYFPDSFPKVSLDEILELKGRKYYEVAANIMEKFITDIPYKELVSICKRVYNFEHPVEKLQDNQYILRLDRGPTASFKDNAAVLMAALMDYYISKSEKSKKLQILTATSGDTGSAVANAYFGFKNVDVVVLFPEKDISINQRLQMTTLGENIYPIAIKGNFDACQDLVTKAFSQLEGKLLLGSANSINIGRLLPQMIYYFDSFLKSYEHNNIVFSVPSGNFGNLTAGLISKNMGLPVKFITGTNANSYFPEFLETGNVSVKKSANCSSSAMSVTKPSNMRRIAYMYGGKLNKEHILSKNLNFNELHNDILMANVISENEVDEVIKKVYNDFNTLLEPHGAVAVAEMLKFSENVDKDFAIIAHETAHPAKFPEKINSLLGFEPKPLPNLQKFLDNKEKEKFEIMGYDYEEFEKFLLTNFK